MHLESIRLVNFRNYRQLGFSPSPGLNVLFGRNGQGKSNLLEAIYLMSATRSPRTSRDQEMIRMGDTCAFIEAVFDREERGEIEVSLSIARDKTKNVKINSSAKRCIDLIGEVNEVCFIPEDLEMVKGGPADRRIVLNREISQISRLHCHHLQQYNRVLRNRNMLLKKKGPFSDEVDAWSEQLIKLGSRIIYKRRQYLEDISVMAAERHRFLAGCEDVLKISYVSRVMDKIGNCDMCSEEDISSAYMKLLKEEIKRESIYRTTMAGPHRDDMRIFLGDRDLHVYGSQGEQRTAVLAFKLAAMDMVKSKVGEWPMLLLDDVLSELDDH
ncbi:MAG: DNA replication/repair protein RecF, partial [bacterium]|nr:DNA replication/repair protein RecF [bacterium]